MNKNKILAVVCCLLTLTALQLTVKAGAKGKRCKCNNATATTSLDPVGTAINNAVFGPQNIDPNGLANAGSSFNGNALLGGQNSTSCLSSADIALRLKNSYSISGNFYNESTINNFTLTITSKNTQSGVIDYTSNHPSSNTLFKGVGIARYDVFQFNMPVKIPPLQGSSLPSIIIDDWNCIAKIDQANPNQIKGFCSATIFDQSGNLTSASNLITGI